MSDDSQSSSSESSNIQESNNDNALERLRQRNELFNSENGSKQPSNGVSPQKLTGIDKYLRPKQSPQLPKLSVTNEISSSTHVDSEEAKFPMNPSNKHPPNPSVRPALKATSVPSIFGRK